MGDCVPLTRADQAAFKIELKEGDYFSEAFHDLLEAQCQIIIVERACGCVASETRNGRISGYGTRMRSSPCRTLIQPSGWAAHSRQAAAIASMSSCVPSPLVRSCSVIAEPAMRSAHVPPQASRDVGSA